MQARFFKCFMPSKTRDKNVAGSPKPPSSSISQVSSVESDPSARDSENSSLDNEKKLMNAGMMPLTVKITHYYKFRQPKEYIGVFEHSIWVKKLVTSEKKKFCSA